MASNTSPAPAIQVPRATGPSRIPGHDQLMSQRDMASVKANQQKDGGSKGAAKGY